MLVTHLAASIALIALTACAGTAERNRPAEPPVADTPQNAPVSSKPADPVASGQTATASKDPGPAPASAPVTQTAPAPAEPAPKPSPPAPAEAPAPKAVKAEPQPAKPVPAKPVAVASTAATPAATTAAKKDPPAAAPRPAGQTLDLTALEKRLRDTNAIGMMTKITLKNQVDDLLERFRAHYDGRSRTPVTELRQPYEALILKVLSLLQDKDPALANAIAASREAIWGILTDPAQFSNL